jgi:SAM-dependent methyltransferase
MNTAIATAPITTSNNTPNFDPIARPYRWLEYLTLGPTLQRCRTHFIPALLDRKNALVLGDGDGRFLAQLLSANPALHADAIDTSAAMLRILKSHCEAATPTTSSRLETHHTNALTFNSTRSYDLVVTHFFLDCLTQSELEALINRLASHLQPGALWLISDFQIPAGALRPFAKLYVRSLYLAFRLLTGLRTTRLPDHAAALAGRFTRIAQHSSFAELLTTELWQITPAVHVLKAGAAAQTSSASSVPRRFKAPSAVKLERSL